MAGYGVRNVTGFYELRQQNSYSSAYNMDRLGRQKLMFVQILAIWERQQTNPYETEFIYYTTPAKWRVSDKDIIFIENILKCKNRSIKL